jgi:uncharacterized protein YdeI (BOF family)
MIHRNNNRRTLLPVLLPAVAVSSMVLSVTGRATPPAALYSPASRVISIAEARSLPLGTVVTVEGSVTVPSGAFNSSTFDQGFAIQDHTGGIYVSVPDNLGFEPRQQVRVTGQLSEINTLLDLTNVTDIKPEGRGPKVQPLPVTTGAVNESTEGKLLKVRATITQPVVNDLPFGFIIVINDGSGEVNSFVCASTGIDVSGLQQGQTIEVTGFSGEFADHFEVDPRFQDDIKVVS